MDGIKKWAAEHRKFLVALAGASLTAISLAWPDAVWVAVVVSVATALGVNQVPNAKAQPAVAAVPAEPEPPG
jgi:hypothetical protein